MLHLAAEFRLTESLGCVAGQKVPANYRYEFGIVIDIDFDNEPDFDYPNNRFPEVIDLLPGSFKNITHGRYT